MTSHDHEWEQPQWEQLEPNPWMTVNEARARAGMPYIVGPERRSEPLTGPYRPITSLSDWDERMEQARAAHSSLMPPPPEWISWMKCELERLTTETAVPVRIPPIQPVYDYPEPAHTFVDMWNGLRSAFRWVFDHYERVAVLAYFAVLIWFWFTVS